MPLRALHFSKWQPGMTVGQALVAENGDVLVDEGLTLTSTAIEALPEQGHTQLVFEVADDFEEQLEHVDPTLLNSICDALSKRGVPPADRAEILRAQAIEDLGKICGLASLVPLLGYSKNVNDLSRQAIDMIAKKSLSAKVLAILLTIKSADPSQYVHSLATAGVAILIGRAVDLSKHRMQHLAVGALLHDFGTIFLAKDLDEQTHARQHTLLGYHILRKTEYVEAVSAQIVLQHHEHADGSGEPLGVISNNVLEPSRSAMPPVQALLAEITAVADYYIERVMGQCAEGPIRPDIVLKGIHEGTGTSFNAAVVEAFLKGVNICTEGSEVMVRGGDKKGYRGQVVRVNEERLDRPVITLTHDNNGDPLEEPIGIDLLEEDKIRIERRQW